MSIGVDKLLKLLEVRQIDKYLFSGVSPKRPARIFGGQVLAQALNAATRTVDASRITHSMHAYFLRPGNPSKQIIYAVDPIRDGKSFTTRNVIAKQDGIAIFSASVSYHIAEPGLQHHFDMLQVPPPEELESDFDRWTRLAQEHPGKIDPPILHPIERKAVQPRDYLNPQPQEPQQQIWFRATGDLGDDLCRHQTVLAFMSDFGLLGTALLPHPHTGMDKGLQSASLDHALWFHHPFRADEHLLYVLDSPVAAAGRGFSRGSFYTREGLLVASTAQECLLRLHTS
ncbi:MAG: acyl-CoA thioesterase II [Haliea sp.]|nr:acyl-CoA thioesterase II [Haliea sp.]MBK6736800.1 acyl-CoA thioesterase II [Haliea sp.]